MDITKHESKSLRDVGDIIDAESEARKNAFQEIYTFERDRLLGKIQSNKGWATVGVVQMGFGSWFLYAQSFSWWSVFAVICGLNVALIALFLALNNRQEARRFGRKLERGSPYRAGSLLDV